MPTVSTSLPDVDVPSSRSAVPPVLAEFAGIVLLLSVVSTAYCLIARLVLHRHYPYVWPFFFPDIRFSDFTIYQQKFSLFHQLAFWHMYFPFTYPAPMALCYEFFFRLFGIHALRVFLVFSVLAFAVPAGLFAKALIARGLTPLPAAALSCLLLFSSWPSLLMLDRANVEIFVWIAITAGVWAYSRGREWTAAMWFGIAASLKLFPFMLLALFFTRRKWPRMFFGAAVYLGVTVVALAVLGPTIPVAYHGIADGLRYFHDAYMAKYLANESGLDHTPLALLKTLVAAKMHPDAQPALDALVRVYVPLSVVVGILLYFLRIRKMPWLNQLLLLTIAAIYFTPFSGDGTLVHLYPPFALCCFVALDAWRRRVSVPGLRVAMYCFAYLFAIESFVIVAGRRMEGQGKCIALGILFLWALRYPFGEPVADAPAPEDLSHPQAARIETAQAIAA